MPTRGPSTRTTTQHHSQRSTATERTVRWERAVLGCLLEAPKLWKGASGLDQNHFLLADHKKIFAAIKELNEQGCEADIVSVSVQLGETVAVDYLGALVDGAVPENFKSYVSHLRESERDLRFQKLQEQLAEASPADRVALLDLMRELLRGESTDQNWRGIFHTVEEFENAAPLQFAINGFLQEAGVTLIGGLSGHGKTLVMMSMVKALLEESPLFGYEHFTVPRAAARVLYLVPESSLGPFWSRIQLFRLQEFVRADRLLVRTLSSREQVFLDDVRLLKAAEGADIFLDTAVRFMDGSENDVESTRPFADVLFRLLNAGARSITGAHHAPKGFEAQDYMSLQNILRGSGDLGAMLCTCWGVRQVDAAKNQLYVENIKPRDFQPCAPFVLEGRPHLDQTGQFKMLEEPTEGREMRTYLRSRGRPVIADKHEKLSQAVELRGQGKGIRDIAKAVGVGKSTVDRWLFEHDASQKCPAVG